MSKSKTSQRTDPIEVFFSYSHKDEPLRDELERQLTVLKRQGVITAWHDRKITAGEEWKGEIDAHLATARIILLLVSADFLASDYCYDIEMKRALERHEAREARVIPVILRAVDNWQDAPFGKLQALPTDGKAVTSWPNQDEAFADVARGIRVALNELTAKPVPGAPRHRQGATALPPICNLPHLRNPNFTGRKDLLKHLSKALTSGKHAALTQAIHGLGGVGKTQLAVEYAYVHASDYDLIWWVRAEEPATLAANYAGLAEPLSLPQKDAADQREIVAAVRLELGQRERWLLVFDNAGQPDSIRDYLPQGAGGHVIITSRSPAWGGVARSLPVQVWEPGESVEFLVKRTDRDDEAAARALAEALGNFPLALEQAAAYTEETGATFGNYLKLFQTRHRELWARAKPPEDYPDTVATTWSVAMDRVREESLEGADLLSLCAFLGPDDIPHGMLRDGVEHVPEPLAAAVRDDMKFNDALAALRRYSLVEVADEGLSLHRLVQAVTRDRLSEDDSKMWAEAAVRVVNSAFPYDSDAVRYWPTCSRLLPHALAAAERAEELDVGADAAGRLFNQAGLYLQGRAQFAEAKTSFEHALAMNEAAHGPDHPTVATCVNNLGLVLHELGDLKGARAHFERALKIAEAAYGPNHPNVAACVNNLGGVLRSMGDLAGARAHFERALKISEAAYGPDHPNVAACVNNLGGVLRDMGDLAGARSHIERALTIDEATYGPDHPTVAIRVNNLGNVLQDLGDLEGARAHYERALTIDEATYGPDHPTVAIRVNNLGNVLQDLGDLEGARAHYERALKIDEAAYGPDHPDVATDVNNLGGVLRAMGDLKGARAHFERALAIWEAAYGRDHPTVATCVNNLGSVLRSMGDLEGARAHFERALAICRKFLGEEHPNTVAVRRNLEILDAERRRG